VTYGESGSRPESSTLRVNSTISETKWECLGHDHKVPPLRVNPTRTQMKQHEEETFEGESCYLLHSALTNDVFTSIMNLETANQIWDETSQNKTVLKKNHLQILCMLGQPNPSTVLQQTAPSALQGLQIYMQTSDTLLNTRHEDRHDILNTFTK